MSNAHPALAGSACHQGGTRPSPVLTAMSIPPERALSALSLTVGRFTTEDDLARAAGLIADAAGALT